MEFHPENIMTFDPDDESYDNLKLSDFIEYLSFVRDELGDIKIATYDYEEAKIKKIVYDTRFNIYLKENSDGELEKAERDDKNGEYYFLINFKLN